MTWNVSNTLKNDLFSKFSEIAKFKVYHSINDVNSTAIIRFLLSWDSLSAQQKYYFDLSWYIHIYLDLKNSFLLLYPIPSQTVFSLLLLKLSVEGDVGIFLCIKKNQVMSLGQNSFIQSLKYTTSICCLHNDSWC